MKRDALDKLEFNTSVLGQKAAERLRNGEVSVTFRSQPPKTRRVEVYLDDELLGETDIKVSQHRVCLAVALDPDIAKLSGFDTVGEHEATLKRAGFRFKPIGEYYVYQITISGIEKREMALVPSREQPQERVRVIEKVVEVPTETTIIKEVPVVQRVVRTVEVPVEKTVIKEVQVIHKIPVEPKLAENQLQGLIRSIANKIVLPSKPVETRIWQLRTATAILNFLKPYLKIEPKEVSSVQVKGR